MSTSAHPPPSPPSPTAHPSKKQRRDSPPPPPGPTTTTTVNKNDPSNNKQQQLPSSKKQKRKGKDRHGPLLADLDDVFVPLVERILSLKVSTDGKNKPRVQVGEEENMLEMGSEIQGEIIELASNGDGVFIYHPQTPPLPESQQPSEAVTSSSTKNPLVVFVPFCLPGETIKARVHKIGKFHAQGDLVEIITRNEQLRGTPSEESSRIKCRYFGKCSGCQYQMLPYDDQLEQKRKVVSNAFRDFSGLPSTTLPEILPTMPSPRQYNYRTKLTPHFQVPGPRRRRGGNKGNTNLAATTTDGNGDGTGGSKPLVENQMDGKLEDGEKEDDTTMQDVTMEENGTEKIPANGDGNREGDGKTKTETAIGFDEKGRKRILDIEDCTIATEVIRDALPIERKRVKENINSYKRGATLLLRDSLLVSSTIAPGKAKAPVIQRKYNDDDDDTQDEEHLCVTDHNAIVRERVGKVDFEFTAGSFFQNNNSILPPLIEYISVQLPPRQPQNKNENASFTSENPSSSSSPSTSPSTSSTYLIDAYCGCGFFSCSLAPWFDKVVGIEIASDSVRYATHNAKLNGIENASFVEGSAEKIFDSLSCDPRQTHLIIDPPRKGSNPAFLDQVLAFGPRHIIYVSCNVHTQARDVGYLIRGGSSPNSSSDSTVRNNSSYRIKSIRGCDFFPQTHHVESICVLERSYNDDQVQGDSSDFTNEILNHA